MQETSKYVTHFVNRERQYRGFLKLPAGELRWRIMFLVVAPEGMGKTLLAQRMGPRVQPAVESPATQFNFRDSGDLTTPKTVRKATRPDCAIHYNQLTQVINEITRRARRLRLTIESVEINIRDATLIDSYDHRR